MIWLLYRAPHHKHTTASMFCGVKGHCDLSSLYHVQGQSKITQALGCETGPSQARSRELFHTFCVLSSLYHVQGQRKITQFLGCETGPRQARSILVGNLHVLILKTEEVRMNDTFNVIIWLDLESKSFNTFRAELYSVCVWKVHGLAHFAFNL